MFKPHLSGGYGHVEIEISELGLLAVGETAEEARDDLLDQVRLYCAEHLDDSLLFERGGADRYLPFVLAAVAADEAGRLTEFLFSGSA